MRTYAQTYVNALGLIAEAAVEVSPGAHRAAGFPLDTLAAVYYFNSRCRCTPDT